MGISVERVKCLAICLQEFKRAHFIESAVECPIPCGHHLPSQMLIDPPPAPENRPTRLRRLRADCACVGAEAERLLPAPLCTKCSASYALAPISQGPKNRSTAPRVDLAKCSAGYASAAISLGAQSLRPLPVSQRQEVRRAARSPYSWRGIIAAPTPRHAAHREDRRATRTPLSRRGRASALAPRDADRRRFSGLRSRFTPVGATRLATTPRIANRERRNRQPVLLSQGPWAVLPSRPKEEKGFPQSPRNGNKIRARTNSLNTMGC